MAEGDFHPIRRPPAVILAGGRSSRMGSPKAGLVLAGKPMLTRVVERLRAQVSDLAINLNDPSVATPSDLTVVPIPYPVSSVRLPVSWLRCVTPPRSHRRRATC